MSTDEPDTQIKPPKRARRPEQVERDTTDADDLAYLSEASDQGYLGIKVDPEPDESYQAGGKLGS